MQKVYAQIVNFHIIYLSFREKTQQWWFFLEILYETTRYMLHKHNLLPLKSFSVTKLQEKEFGFCFSLPSLFFSRRQRSNEKREKNPIKEQRLLTNRFHFPPPFPFLASKESFFVVAVEAPPPSSFPTFSWQPELSQKCPFSSLPQKTTLVQRGCQKGEWGGGRGKGREEGRPSLARSQRGRRKEGQFQFSKLGFLLGKFRILLLFLPPKRSVEGIRLGSFKPEKRKKEGKGRKPLLLQTNEKFLFGRERGG